MPTAKRKKVAKTATEPAPKAKSPFKTKRSTLPAKTADNVLIPPPEVAEAVDAFRAAQDQAKFFEGEATVHKTTVFTYANDEYARRLFAGNGTGFKVQGIETIAMFVVQDASANLSEEDVEDFAARWGKQAADELIVRDFASIRFNPEVLAANYDLVEKALLTLPPDIVENLFKPMAMKAKPDAADAARRHVKNADELREILRHLKLKHYVR